MSAPEYLAKYGPTLIDNGYRIVPIVRGSKAPGLGYPAKKWSELHADHARVTKWIDQGFAQNGIGIITASTPGVDVDCQDDSVVVHMRQFIVDRLGSTIERVGLAPKTLLLYRCDTPFPKVQSNDYIDAQGRKARLEVLAEGQQFVALAIHPDTKNPYRWVNKQGPHNTPVDALPVITRDDALAFKIEFERLARERGWQEKKSLRRLEGSSGGQVSTDNVFLQDAHKIEDLTPEQIRARLQMVPGAEDYETWFQIGMALYHQFDGSPDGLAMWDEWSSTAMNYDQDAVIAKWPTFEIEGKGRAPLTAKVILRMANEAEELLVKESLETAKAAIVAAETISALQEACRPVKSMAFDKLTRGMLAGMVQKKFKEIAKTTLTISDAREMVRFENPENRNVPFWLDGFVYLQMDKAFFNYKTHIKLDTMAFDQSFGRFLMTKQDQLEGKTAPEHPASHVALFQYQIPTVWMAMYMPQWEELFTINGKSYVNSYDGTSVPEMPETISLSGRVAINIVKNHMVHLFRSERDRELLLDWLAYVVQTGNRVSWCPLIQGTEGDGKSWLAAMMAAIFGMENVDLIKGDSLNEKYTSWGEGKTIVFIEEVRLHGKERYAAVNNLKPFITNPRVPIRRMNTDTYTVINRTSYIALSNYRDAIPAGHGDTRYFPMFSNFQTFEDISAFKAANPDYYPNLFNAIKEAGSLRKWFMERQINPDFDADARAPESAHRAAMVDLNQTDEQEAIREALAESKRLDFSRVLLDSALMGDEMTGRGVPCPQGKALKMLLSEFGFTSLGRVKVKGEAKRLWTMEPRRFVLEDGTTDTEAVRRYVELGDL